MVVYILIDIEALAQVQIGKVSDQSTSKSETIFSLETTEQNESLEI